EMGDEFSKVDNDKFKIIECNKIAFDHAEIIACAVEKLRQDLYNHKLAFELLPKYFTLTDLQTICEIVLDEKLIKANFRRKIKDLVSETEKLSEGAGHRPAKLYIKAK
ncbi:MAG: ADP-ribose pyrophosphatase, partial [Clostridiales bacterium]|nr:ADP-ribose pyrophosphatase [Clostridiales bacterium]